MFYRRSYTVWRTGAYIAFVADSTFTSGTVDLLAMFKWMTSKGWLASNSTVDQIDYGFDRVSMYCPPVSFTVNNSSITDPALRRALAPMLVQLWPSLDRHPRVREDLGVDRTFRVSGSRRVGAVTREPLPAG